MLINVTNCLTPTPFVVGLACWDRCGEDCCCELCCCRWGDPRRSARGVFSCTVLEPIEDTDPDLAIFIRAEEPVGLIFDLNSLKKTVKKYSIYFQDKFWSLMKFKDYYKFTSRNVNRIFLLNIISCYIFFVVHLCPSLFTNLQKFWYLN